MFAQMLCHPSWHLPCRQGQRPEFFGRQGLAKLHKRVLNFQSAERAKGTNGFASDTLCKR